MWAVCALTEFPSGKEIWALCTHRISFWEGNVSTVHGKKFCVCAHCSYFFPRRKFCECTHCSHFFPGRKFCECAHSAHISFLEGNSVSVHTVLIFPSWKEILWVCTQCSYFLPGKKFCECAHCSHFLLAKNLSHSVLTQYAAHALNHSPIPSHS